MEDWTHVQSWCLPSRQQLHQPSVLLVGLSTAVARSDSSARSLHPTDVPCPVQIVNTAHSVCVPPAALLFHGQSSMVPSPFRVELTSDQISQIRTFYPLDPTEGA
jgi:hypothetical protein